MNDETEQLDAAPSRNEGNPAAGSPTGHVAGEAAVGQDSSPTSDAAEPALDPAQLLDHYGRPNSHFQGTVELQGADEQGNRQFGGLVWGAQLQDGRIVLACLLTHFERLQAGGEFRSASGRLSDGGSFATEASLNWTNTLDDAFGWQDDPRGVWIVLNATKVIITYPSGLSADAAPPAPAVEDRQATVTERRYRITNFAFEGARRADPNDPLGSGLDVTLEDPETTSSRLVTLRRVPNYRLAVRRLSTLRSTEVTAEIVMRGAEDAPVDDALATDLCYILSVARGTKVQWIAREDRDVNGTVVARHLAAHITKPFAPYSIIIATGWARTKSFIEQAFPVYRNRRAEYALNLVIDGLLDAKLEVDFLEMRGVKLAVTLEAVKNSYALAKGWPAEFVIDPTVFDSMVLDVRPRVQEALAAALADRQLPKKHKSDLAMRGKILGLNRRTFSDLLKDVFKDIGLVLPPEEFDLLIASRNSLVHQGRFYHDSATPEQAARTPRPASTPEEFWSLLDVADRVFLKLLGYTGEFSSGKHGWRVTAQVP